MRHEPKRDAKAILLSVPCSERVPPLTLRLTTRWRRLLMNRFMRRQSLACGANGSFEKGRHSDSNRLSKTSRPLVASSAPALALP